MESFETIKKSERQVPKGVIAIATVLVVLSLYLLGSEVTADGLVDSWATVFSSTPVFASVKLATACVGLVAAIGLWNFHRRAVWVYFIWCVLFFALAFLTDRVVEPVLWKQMVGVLFVAILPVGVAIYLFNRAYPGGWSSD